MKQYLAFDLGASSGRAIIGTLADGKIDLKEVHRFENGGTYVNGGLFWDLLGLFREMKTGLKKALEAGAELSGIAIDTWGVDYAFIDRRGFFAGNAWNYRDTRTDNAQEWVYERIPAREVYAQTGIQFMNLNTIFQLASCVRDDDDSLKIADKLLFIPNALSYMFCGDKSAEYTIASTSQLYDSAKDDWAWPIIDAIGLKRTLFPKITRPCTVVGKLLPQLQEELKCGPIPVILVGSHDTASAVASVPAPADKTWAFLSSGTWSLLGIELPKPCTSEKAMKANYANEGGLCHTIRFLKNIMGLWLVQECRNEWKRRGQIYSFGELADLAAKEQPFRSLINPNNELFATPGDMPGRFCEYCRTTGQPVPETPGQFIRAALESLALRYRQTIDEMEDILGLKVEVLNLVGGGSQNLLLNQFTANAIGRQVVTGPVEGTAMGNILGQALATGDIKDLKAGREIIKNSIETGLYMPKDAEAWNEAYKRFQVLP